MTATGRLSTATAPPVAVMSWRSGGAAAKRAVTRWESSRGGCLPSGSLEVDEEEGLRAFGESGGWFARADGLEARGDFFGVESLEFGAVAEDFDLFERDVAAGEIGEEEFVGEVGDGVGAGEGNGGVLDGEEEWSHFFFGGGGGGEGVGDEGGEDGERDQGGDGDKRLRIREGMGELRSAGKMVRQKRRRGYGGSIGTRLGKTPARCRRYR